MSNWVPIVNKSFKIEEFEDYLKTLDFSKFKPSFVVLHNTFSPNLAQRPDGLTEANMQGFVVYYKGLGWHAGPAAFVDDRQVWIFTGINVAGVHSPSWNHESIGIEMLGDFKTESFDEGRGKLVHENAISVLASIHKVLGLDPHTLKFHFQDPLTSHKCPGSNVIQEKVIAEIDAAMKA